SFRSLCGVLIGWVHRKANPRQFVRQRLLALTRRGVSEAPPSLRRTIRQAASIIPKKLRSGLDAAFEATGNRIGTLHLTAAGLLAAVIEVGFTSLIMGLNPGFVTRFGIVAARVDPVLALRFADPS